MLPFFFFFFSFFFFRFYYYYFHKFCICAYVYVWFASDWARRHEGRRIVQGHQHHQRQHHDGSWIQKPIQIQQLLKVLNVLFHCELTLTSDAFPKCDGHIDNGRGHAACHNLQVDFEANGVALLAPSCQHLYMYIYERSSDRKRKRGRGRKNAYTYAWRACQIVIHDFI